MGKLFITAITRRDLLAALLIFSGMLGALWPMHGAAQDGQAHSPLPDGERSRHGGMTAYLTGPTGRYAHGVLGDAIEAGGFAVERASRPTLRYALGQDAVFEDRRVRLVDLDGDGRVEALVIKSYLARGAAIAAFALDDQGIVARAESPAIGQPNRWLNIVGVAAFLGDGKPVIAAVVTPHLAGSLRFYQLRGAEIVEIARLDGFTNHIIGERDLDLGRVGKLEGDARPSVVIPTRDRRTLVVIGLRDGTARILAEVSSPGPIRRLLPHAADGTYPVVLDDGRRVALRPARREK